MDKELQRKIKELEKAGFKVQKVVKTTKKTFEVPEDTLGKFMDYCHDNRVKVKDAIAEALTDFLKKQQK